MSKPLAYELRVTFKNPMPAKLTEHLSVQFTAAIDVHEALARTALAGVRSYEDHAKFAEELAGRIAIFITEDANTLLIYTEQETPFDVDVFNIKIKELKSHARQRLSSLRRLAKRQKNKIDSIQIAINFGQNPISSATASSFWARLKSKARSNLAARFSMPVASAVAGFALTQRPEDVLKATITGIAAAIVSIVVEAVSEESIKYESAS